jgi:hypothetical protein
VARVCKGLSSVALGDSLWLKICKSRFPDTNPRMWMTSQEQQPSVGRKWPDSYRHWHWHCPCFPVSNLARGASDPQMRVG